MGIFRNCSRVHQNTPFQTEKSIFWAGALFLQDPSPTCRRTPPPTPTPARRQRRRANGAAPTAPRYSRLWRSNPRAFGARCQYLLAYFRPWRHPNTRLSHTTIWHYHVTSSVGGDSVGGACELTKHPKVSSTSPRWCDVEQSSIASRMNERSCMSDLAKTVRRSCTITRRVR